MKKLIAVLLSVALCVSLSACGKEPDQSGTATGPTTESTTVPTEAAEQIDAEVFKGGIRSSVKSMSFFCEIYMLVLEYQVSYWESSEQLLVSRSSKDIAQKGIKTMEGAGISYEDVTGAHQTYSETYKRVVLANIQGRELEEIRNAYMEYFDSYLNIYNLMLSPSSDRKTFASDVSECIKNYKNALSKIYIFLGITPEAIPMETEPVKETAPDLTPTYVLDTKSKIFHYVHCKILAEIPKDDQETVTKRREKLISEGYKKCSECRS